MQKEKQVVNQLKVYDADEEKLTELTQEMQYEATDAFLQLQMGFYGIAFTIERIVRKKLYLCRGYSSQEHFMSTIGFVGRSKAYTMLSVARRMIDVFGAKMIDENVDDKHKGIIQRMEGLGINKLDELMKLENAEIIEIAEGREISIGDAKYTLDDLKQIGYKKLEDQFSKAKKKMQDELSLMNEENKLLKEEIKLKNKQIETADQKMEDAKELEIKYGPAAKTIANKDFLLKECMDNLNEFNDYIIKANVLANDPERIRKQLTDIVKKMNTVAKIVNEAYQEITVDF